jgi:ABC-type transporter Mla maintaining outer membrane lipid asymmetry permease subunit MlaE
MNHSLFQKLIFVTLFAGVVVALTGNSPSRDSSAETSSPNHYTTDLVR